MTQLIAELLRPTRYENGQTAHDPAYRALGDGLRFSFRERFDGSVAGTSEYVRVQIPTDAAEVTGVIRQLGGSGEVRGRVATDFAVDTAGTDRTARNDNIGLSDAPASGLEIQTGGAYTISGDPQDLFSPGGVTGARSGSIGSVISARVQPGADLLYELTPQFDNGSVFFSLVWTERPE